MKYSDLIKDKNIVKLSPKKLNNHIDVAYCIDDNYSIAAGVSIYSLIKNTKNSNISIHLFVLSLSEINRKKFYDFVKNYDHVSLIVYYVNSDIDINENNKTKFPLSASLRIIVPELLKTECDTIIYIDSDTLITKDLVNILKIDNFENNIIGAAIDTESERHSERLNLSGGKYFNSGVMVINTKNWCNSKITQKALSLLAQTNFIYPDQDALNIILHENTCYISSNYNTQIELSNYKKDGDILSCDPSIIHYLGPDKPWFKLFITKKYEKELKQTPWANDELKLVSNVSRIRIYSKRIKRISKFKSIKLLLLYYFCKICKIG